MRVALVTGAAGFIGGYLVREFLAQGWAVRALVHRRVSPELEQLAHDGAVALLQGDVTDPTGLERLIAACPPAAIVHCAGRASDVGCRRDFARANYAPVVTLGTLALQYDVARLVFLSTTDVYGLRDFHGEGEEELPLENNTGNPYPEYKIRAEQWLRREMPAERYAILRPAAVWGVGDRTLTPRAVAFLRSSPWIIHFGRWRGQNRWPLAHVRTVAAAGYLAATQPAAAGQAINVLDSEVTSIDDFYRLLAEIYLPAKRLRPVTLPCWLGQAFGWCISSLSTLANCDHPFTDPSFYALQSITHHLDFSNARLLALLAHAGRQPVTRDEGIAELRRNVGAYLLRRRNSR